MTGVPRSQVLVTFRSAASGSVAVFTCPDNHVTLVKQAAVHNEVSTDVAYSMWIANADSSIVVSLFSGNVGATPDAYWDKWVVMNPGHKVWFHAAAGGIHAWVSGAVLAGPPLFPPAVAVGVESIPGGLPAFLQT